jgi:hypothetical protein
VEKKERKSTKKGWRLWILLPFFLLLLPFLLAALLLIPTVQSWAVQRSLGFASSYVDAEITLGGIYLEPIKTLRLHDLLILDQQRDTLLYVNVLRLDLTSFDREELAVNLDEVELRNAYLNLYRPLGKEQLNMQFLLDAFSSDTTDTSKTPFSIQCDELVLDRLRFDYEDRNLAQKEAGMVDFDHISIQALSGRLTDIAYAEQLVAEVHGLHFREQSGLQLRCLNAQVGLSDTLIALDEMDLITNRSILAGAYRMHYTSFEDFKAFLTAVEMEAHLRQSLLYFDDIAFFAPTVKGLLTPLNVTADIQGPLSRLIAEVDSISFSNSGILKGRLRLRGLPDPDQLMIDANLNELSFTPQDFTRLGIPVNGEMQHIALPALIQDWGTITYAGRLNGFLNDFTTYGSIQTIAGRLETDINLKIDEQVSYSGKLASSNLDLAMLLADPTFGKTSFDIEVKGSEFDPERIDLDANGNVRSIEIQGYPYSNITLDGHFQDNQVEGNLSLNDPNARVDFTGTIDFSSEVPEISCLSRLTNIKIGQLNLIPEDTFGVINANIDLQMGGVTMDALHGSLYVSDLSYENEAYIISMDTVVLRDRLVPLGHRITLNTAFAHMVIEGQTNLSVIHLAFLDILKHYAPELIATEQGEAGIEDQEFQVSLTVDHKTQVMQLLHPDFKLQSDLKLNAEIRTADHSFELNLDSLDWFLNDVKAEAMTVHVAPLDGRLYNEVQADRFSLANDYFLDNFGLRNQLKNDSLESEIYWSNRTELADSGSVKLLSYRSDEHPYNVRLRELYARIAGETWKSYSKASLKADTNYIIIDDFDVRSDRGFVVCNGQVSGKPSDQIELDVKDLDLGYLSNFGLNQNVLEGFFTGSVKLSKREGAYIANSLLQIRGLQIDGVEVGNIDGVTAYNSDRRAVDLGLDVEYKQNRNVRLNGQVYPFRNEEQLELDLSLDAFRLEILEPFISDYASDLAGYVEGTVAVGGMINAPEISGTLQLNAFEGLVDYLNTRYTIPKADIIISDGFIGSDYTVVMDENGSRAYLTATIFHDNFKDFNYDIFIDAKEFMALNTNVAQNEAYYGMASITGDIDISGYKGITNIVVNAETEKGTKLSIPLASSDEVNDLDYIRFIPPPDAKTVKKKEEDVVAEDLNTLNLDFQLSVDNEAEVQIIFDQKIGDVIKVRGNGDILMKIDNRGSFNMYGDYTMSGGDYLFTLQNVINKRFAVNPGSKITWNGSPTEAEVDLAATYNLRAAPINLTASVGDTSEAYKKRMPVDVLLNMKGPLMEPVITFDVELPSLPESDLANQLLNPRTTSEQDMNQQVFALLLTNNFFAQGSGVSTLSGVGQNTTYEMVSNQFSNWISQYFDNVDVGVMVGNQTELNVSTELLNDRMLVELNGSVQGEQGGTDNSNNFAGEFNIEYKINKDGSLRARVFNEANNYNPTNLNQAPYTQGVGAFYRREFDTFGDLFRSVFGGKKKPTNTPKDGER